MRLINGNRQNAESELLRALWADATPRYKALLNKLYPGNPELELIKKPAVESVTTPPKFDNLRSPSDSPEI
ncbi:hypothetical protein INP77_12545 [Methylophilus sp. 13]|uniref:hypothetical protein n=1 Tax=Methylophilus sp. 13 TaxID=2781018 RepID=UPI0018905363|nr:hypothetical protein [Methylophilus sp. 13]MBF5040321.1 hypothetical protein [Methylophilus sp. 13]